MDKTLDRPRHWRTVGQTKWQTIWHFNLPIIRAWCSHGLLADRLFMVLQKVSDKGSPIKLANGLPMFSHVSPWAAHDLSMYLMHVWSVATQYAAGSRGSPIKLADGLPMLSHVNPWAAHDLSMYLMHVWSVAIQPMANLTLCALSAMSPQIARA